MFAKLLAVAVAASSVGLVVYGTSEPAQPAPAQPVKVEAKPTASPVAAPVKIEPPASAMTPWQALIKPFPRLQNPPPPVDMGLYVIPRTVYLTVTSVSDPQINYLVSTTTPLSWVGTGAWSGNLQLPQGGITFAFTFSIAQPPPVSPPFFTITASAGGRNAAGVFDPSRWIFEGAHWIQPVSMNPLQVVGTMRGRSPSYATYMAPGAVTVGYVIRP